MSESENLLEIVSDIVSAHVSNNSVAASDLPALIKATYDALANLGAPEPEAPAEKPVGAVSIRKSLANDDHIISMIDGKPYTMLKRHLSQNGMTPAEYRQTYGLPADYPMTSVSYSAKRRELAHSIGLGRKKAPAPVTAKAERKPRAKKAATAEA